MLTPPVIPQLVANNGMRALRLAISDPDRDACEPTSTAFAAWSSTSRAASLRRATAGLNVAIGCKGDAFEGGLRRLADRPPNLWDGIVLDGGLIAGRLAGTMAAMRGGKA